MKKSIHQCTCRRSLKIIQSEWTLMHWTDLLVDIEVKKDHQSSFANWVDASYLHFHLYLCWNPGPIIFVISVHSHPWNLPSSCLGTARHSLSFAQWWIFQFRRIFSTLKGYPGMPLWLMIVISYKIGFAILIWPLSLHFPEFQFKPSGRKTLYS